MRSTASAFTSKAFLVSALFFAGVHMSAGKPPLERLFQLNDECRGVFERSWESSAAEKNDGRGSEQRAFAVGRI